MSARTLEIENLRIAHLTIYLANQVTVVRGDINYLSKEIVLQMNSKIYDWLYAQYEDRLKDLEEHVGTIVSSKLLVYPPIRIHVLGNNVLGSKVKDREFSVEYQSKASPVVTIDIGFDKLERDGMFIREGEE